MGVVWLILVGGVKIHLNWKKKWSKHLVPLDLKARRKVNLKVGVKGPWGIKLNFWSLFIEYIIHTQDGAETTAAA